MDFGQNSLQWQQVGLFGGPFRVSIPHNFKDLSDVVPINDNQEVFTDINYDAQLIFELLQMTDKPDEGAIEYNFMDLSEANKALDPVIQLKRELEPADIPNFNITSEFKGYILVGTQKIIPSKRLHDPRDFVTIYMALFRLKQYDTDFLFTLNVPDKTQLISDGTSEKYKTLLQLNEFIFKGILNSFTVSNELELNALFAI